jgi:hypothetical protein
MYQMAVKQKKFDNMDEPLPKPDPVRDRPTHPVDPAKVAVKDIVCIYSYARVKEVGADSESLLVEDLLLGGEFNIEGRDMIAAVASADFFAETIRVSKTEMARILTTTHGKPFTVAFVKKDGQERVLRGYFLSHEEMFGRSLCLDLDLEKTDNLRLVDHRSLVSLVVEGVRYILT